MTDIKNSDQSAPLLNQQDNADGKSTQNDVVANATSPPPVSSQQSRTEINQQWKYRFEVTSISLATLMLACLLQAMATSSYSIVRIMALPCALFLAFYIYQWIFFFSDGLTRPKRAFSNVKLQTYQSTTNKTNTDKTASTSNTDNARPSSPDSPTTSKVLRSPKVLSTPPSTNESPNKSSKQNKEQKKKGTATAATPPSTNESPNKSSRQDNEQQKKTGTAAAAKATRSKQFTDKQGGNGLFSSFTIELHDYIPDRDVITARSDVSSTGRD